MSSPREDEFYTTSEVPYMPAQVDLRDLKDNHKLLTEAQIAALKMAGIEQGRTKKNALILKENPALKDLEYDVTKVGEKYYAIYHGLTNRKHLGTTHDDTVIVKLAQDLDSREWVAMKVIKPSKDLNDTRDHTQLQEDLHTEIKGLDQAGHLKASYTRDNKEGKEQSEILMTLAPGSDLWTIALTNGFKPVSRWLDIAIGSLEVVQAAHEKGLLHRDIKGGNIMYGRGKAYLVDFGQAVYVPGEKIEKRNDLVYGTPDYRAPEVNEGIYNEKTEMYALGVTVAELLGLSTRVNGFVEIILNPDEISLNRIPDEITRRTVYQLIERMVDADPDNRPTFSEAINELKRIRDEQLDINSRFLRLGYLDIHEFSGATPEQKNEMLKALQQVDEVRLIGRTNDKDVTDWIKVAHELEVEGLCVSDKSLQCDDTQVANAIIKYTQELEKSDNSIYNAIYISPKQMTDEIKNKFHEQSVVCIIAGNDIKDISAYNNEIETGIVAIKVTDINYNKVLTDIHRKYNEIMFAENRKGFHGLQAKFIENVMLKLDEDKTKNSLTYEMMLNQVNSFKSNLDIIQQIDSLKEKFEYTIESYKSGITDNYKKIDDLRDLSKTLKDMEEDVVQLKSTREALHSVLDKYNTIVNNDELPRPYSDKYHSAPVPEQLQEDIQHYTRLQYIGMADNQTQWQIDESRNLLAEIQDNNLLNNGVVQIKHANITRAAEQEFIQNKVSALESLIPGNVDAYQTMKQDAIDLRDQVNRLEISVGDANKQYNLIKLQFDKQVMQEKIDYKIDCYQTVINSLQAEKAEIDEREAQSTHQPNDLLRQIDIDANVNSYEIIIDKLERISNELINSNAFADLDKKYEDALPVLPDPNVPTRIESADSFIPADDESGLSHLLFKLNTDILHHQKMLRIGMQSEYTSWELEKSIFLENIIKDANFTDYAAAEKMYSIILNPVAMFKIDRTIDTYAENTLSLEHKARVAEIKDDLVNLRINADDALIQYTSLKRDHLKSEIVTYSYKLKSILEKIMLLENYKQSVNDKLFDSELHLVIAQGYQAIAANLPALLKLNSLILKEDISDEEFTHALNAEVSPINNLNKMLMFIRKNISQDEFNDLSNYSRDNLSSSSSEKKQPDIIDPYKGVREDANAIIERVILDYRNKVESYVPEEESGLMSAEEFDVNPHDNLQIQKNSARQIVSKETNENDNTLAFLSNPISHVPVTLENFQREENELSKVTAKLEAAVVKIEKRNEPGKVSLEELSVSKKKKIATKLNKLENKVNTLLLIDKGLESKEKIRAKDILSRSKIILPKDREITREKYKEIKLELEEQIKAFRILSQRTDAEGTHSGSFTELKTLYESIDKNSQELKKRYDRLKESKKPLIKKLKGGEGVALLRSEKKYANSLEENRNQYHMMLKNHERKKTAIDAILYKDKNMPLLNQLVQAENKWKEPIQKIINELNEILSGIALPYVDIKSFNEAIDKFEEKNIEKFLNIKIDIEKTKEKIKSENKIYASNLELKANQLGTNVNIMLESLSTQERGVITFKNKLQGIAGKIQTIKPNKSFNDDPFSYTKLTLVNKSIADLEDEYRSIMKNRIQQLSEEGLTILDDMKDKKIRNGDSKLDLIEKYKKEMNELRAVAIADMEYSPVSLVFKYNRLMQVNQQIDKLKNEILLESKDRILPMQIRIDSMNAFMSSLSTDHIQYFDTGTFQKIINIQSALTAAGSANKHDDAEIEYSNLDEVEKEIAKLERSFKADVAKEIRRITLVGKSDLNKALAKGVRTDDASNARHTQINELIINADTNFKGLQFSGKISIDEMIARYNTIQNINIEINHIFNEIEHENKQYADDIQQKTIVLISVIQSGEYMHATTNKIFKNRIDTIARKLSRIDVLQVYQLDPLSYKSMDEMKDKFEILRADFRNAMTEDIIKNATINAALLIKIKDRGMREGDTEKMSQYNALLTESQSLYNRIKNANAMSENDFDELGKLIVKNGEKIATFDNAIINEWVLIRKQLSSEMKKIRQDAIPLISRLENEEHGETILHVQNEGSDTIKTMLEAIHLSDQLSYKNLDKTQAELDDLNKKCEVIVLGLSMQSIIRKELKSLTVLKDDSLESIGMPRADTISRTDSYISSIIEKMQKIDEQIGSLDTKTLISMQLNKLSALKSDLMILVFDSVINSLDENIASLTIDKSSLMPDSLLTFYDPNTKKLRIDYETFLEKDNPRYQELDIKFKWVVDLLKKQNRLIDNPHKVDFAIHETTNSKTIQSQEPSYYLSAATIDEASRSINDYDTKERIKQAEQTFEEYIEKYDRYEFRDHTAKMREHLDTVAEQWKSKKTNTEKNAYINKMLNDESGFLNNASSAYLPVNDKEQFVQILHSLSNSYKNRTLFEIEQTEKLANDEKETNKSDENEETTKDELSRKAAVEISNKIEVRHLHSELIKIRNEIIRIKEKLPLIDENKQVHLTLSTQMVVNRSRAVSQELNDILLQLNKIDLSDRVGFMHNDFQNIPANIDTDLIVWRDRIAECDKNADHLRERAHLAKSTFVLKLKPKKLAQKQMTSTTLTLEPQELGAKKLIIQTLSEIMTNTKTGKKQVETETQTNDANDEKKEGEGRRK